MCCMLQMQRSHIFACSCASTSIDGGRDYTKISYEPNTTFPSIEFLQLPFHITEIDLVDDWRKELPNKGLFGQYGKLNEPQYVWDTRIEMYILKKHP